MVMSKKKRGVQLECTCGAYPFPHRLGGGKCDGTEWAEKEWIYGDQSICYACNLMPNGLCQVAAGLEKLKYCGQYQEQKRMRS